MEYEAQQSLLQMQTPLVQRFLEAQARQVADALVGHFSQVRFQFPDRVLVEGKSLAISPDLREQMVGGLMDRLTRADLRVVLRARLL